ncbi:hypothetical protein [Pseudomonas aeruginosa]|uniref:hypothetical protein n=1 Tax=Pseudomonas aeruginosa TaxID=287 RepID=UPI00398390BE
MEQAMRDEFEAWLLPSWSRERFVDGEGDWQYVEDWVQGAWIGWQASRAALRVELPERRDPLNSTGDDENPRSAGFNDCLERVTEAFRLAGIEVK